MDEETFLRRLDAAPGDDALRLTYADGLTAHGDPRGDFLRAAVAARAVAAGHPDLPQLARRVADLRPVAPPAWVRRAYPELADDDAREVVFRWLLGSQYGLGTFVQVDDGRNPSPFLLTQLVEHHPGLQPASAAELRGGVYWDRRTGFAGYMVGTGRPAWGDDGRCAVEGEVFFDGLATQGNFYWVEVREGWWAVAGGVSLWVS